MVWTCHLIPRMCLACIECLLNTIHSSNRAVLQRILDTDKHHDGSISVGLEHLNIPAHIRLRLQRAAADIRRASVDRFDSNTNPVPRKTHKLDCPTARISGSQGSSILPSVPFLQCLRRHNERDSLRKFSHCPPQSTSRLPLCPRTPALEYCCLSDAISALALGPLPSASVLLTGSGRPVRLGPPIATSRSSAVRNTISVRHLPTEGACPMLLLEYSEYVLWFSVLTYHPSGSCGGGEDGPAVSAGASGAISDLTGSSRCQNVERKSRGHPKS